MDIRIPSLLRIKPNALFKLGKYLRKNGFDRIALFYGDGMEALVGQSVQISMASSVAPPMETWSTTARRV